MFAKSSLYYLDESGFESTTDHRTHGRAKQGEKVISDISGKRAKRVSVIAALNDKNIIAPGYFEGYTDSEVFNLWLAKSLIPELKKGDVIIMDNASFHKTARTKEIIEEAGCILVYLPTYSPDLNPIEKKWAHIKARIRKFRKKYESLEEALDDQLSMNNSFAS